MNKCINCGKRQSGANSSNLCEHCQNKIRQETGAAESLLTIAPGGQTSAGPKLPSQAFSDSTISPQQIRQETGAAESLLTIAPRGQTSAGPKLPSQAFSDSTISPQQVPQNTSAPKIPTSSQYDATLAPTSSKPVVPKVDKSDESLFTIDVRRCKQCGSPVSNNYSALCDSCSGSSPDSLSTIAPVTAQAGSIEVGMRFGEFELLSEIDRGAMGVVFKARHIRLNRIVALKMILSGRFADSMEVLRFRHEAESAAKLDHPGIVPVFEVGESEGHHYFAMKLISGGSLRDRLPELHNDTKRLAEIVASIAEAMQYAHQRGIIHRDLKPGNVLFDDDGSPVVVDLGLAKSEGGAHLTRTGAIMGTPGYMPPEQAAGQDTTAAADIYALGAILYHGITGHVTHEAETAVKSLMKILHEDLVPIRRWVPSVDRTLELICQKCLERDPSKRYLSAGALAVDLRNWVVGDPVSVRPQSASTMIGRAVREQLRSALSAMIIGLTAGAVFALSLWVWFVGPNLATLGDVYAVFESESRPIVLSLPKSGPSHTVAFVLTVICICFPGLVTALVVRPKPGNQALATGLICGLASTCASCSLFGAWIGVMAVSFRPIETELSELSRGVFGNPLDRAKAISVLTRKHPDLKEDAQLHSDALGRKLYVDGLANSHKGILAAVLVLGGWGLVSGLGGTLLGARLIVQRKSLAAVILRFSEIAFTTMLIATLVALLYGNRLLGIPSPLPNTFLFLTMLCFAVSVIYGITKSWKFFFTRLAIHCIWIFLFVHIFARFAEMSKPDSSAAPFVASGDLQGATSFLESVRSATPHTDPLVLLATIYARLGDSPKYDAICVELVGKHCDTVDLSTAISICMSCLIQPNAVSNSEILSELVDFVVIQSASGPDEPASLILQALLHYRAGRFPDAVLSANRCREAIDKSPIKRPEDFFLTADAKAIIAMSNCKMGDTASAVSQYSSLNDSVNEHLLNAKSGPSSTKWIDRLRYEILASELQEIAH